MSAFSLIASAICMPTVIAGDKVVAFDVLEKEYTRQIRPLLAQFCNDCHSPDEMQGDLDLARFDQLSAIRRDAQPWQKVAQMLSSREMPPEESPQLSKEQSKLLRNWVDQYLAAEARANAGDPGPVVLRRLNNAEYTYTVRDLTGVDLDPARQFPVDGAAGEGFTNIGNALVMSPALVTKYFDAAREIAQHAVLLPDGFRFSASTTRRDWTNEILNEIRDIYLQHTGRVGDVTALNRWDVANPKSVTDEDGRVELDRYFTALIDNRDQIKADLNHAEAIAQRENLNAKYLRILAGMLLDDQQNSLLLNHIRHRWQNASREEGPKLAAEIRAWQDKAWKYNVVGHFGSIRPWQVPDSPLTTTQNFSVPLAKNANGDKEDSGEVSLFLKAGSAGDGSADDVVQWINPRIQRKGQPAVLLRDVCGLTAVLNRMRPQALAATAKYLAAAYEMRTSDEKQNLTDVAKKHGVEPLVLSAWLSYLGISNGEQVIITDYLSRSLQIGGYNFVKGWGLPGVEVLALVSNSSDNQVKIPGDMNPHQIAVHPLPDRWIAVGWKSPITGKVRLAPVIQHAHPQCGNGVSWTLELRRGDLKRVLQTGDVDLGGASNIAPLEDLDIEAGDLVSLKIGPRDGNHACDLTQIDLIITEGGDQKREWSLSRDCADSITAGNPHTDSLDNGDVWHFYAGMISGNDSRPVVPADSLLARWLDTSNAEEAARLAAEVETRITAAMTTTTADPLYQRLAASDGLLFSQIDPAALAQLATPEELEATKFGLDPGRFGKLPDGSTTVTENLIVSAPAVIEIKLPASLLADAEFVATATLLDANSNQASVQFDVATNGPQLADTLLPGVPVVVNSGSEAESRLQKAFDDFRHYFPAAMCYPKIVPVDEVVTLVLFHREDEQLSRLMLDKKEAAMLDRLWNELHYVSQNALTSVTVFDQLMEFASQDGDPSLYEPLREPINNRAAAFRQQLVDSEPAQLKALLEWASEAYRRPLWGEERASLKRFYADLRSQELPHDEAIQLLLARVLASPVFLYRLEKPSPGEQPTPVSDYELASRLSYFLWSSLPDAALRQQAEAGQLQDPGTLLAQTHRLLQSNQTRRLAIEMGCQWLHIRDFDQFDEKSERHFPQFANLRAEMYEESILFFTDLFQNDRSILNILDADYTFLNETLAKHYGIPDVEGTQWRRVEGVKMYSRGGILTQATTLAKQSGASRTSAILRGNWVYETLLGERLPRPPKDVPVLPETVPEGLTERALIELHSSAPACAKCHVRIDPYGFALENYDAIGGYREKDESGHAIGTQTELQDGTTISGVDGLRGYLLSAHQDTFVRHFCRKLLGYALGRGVQLSDQPLLDEIMIRLAENNYRVSVAVETIVLSDQFRKIRGMDYQSNGLADSDTDLSNDASN